MVTTRLQSQALPHNRHQHINRDRNPYLGLPRVLAVAMDGTAEIVAHVPQQSSGLWFLADGRMLIVSIRDRKVLRREIDGSLVEHADLSGLAPWHVNDMLVDHDGRAWVGNFGFDFEGGFPTRTTVLICGEPDGTARVVADGLGFPNGMMLTPGARTLSVAEPTMNRISAFDINSGLLGERQTWAGETSKGCGPRRRPTTSWKKVQSSPRMCRSPQCCR